MAATTTRVRIECDALSAKLEVAELEGREALSQGFEFDVLVVTHEAAGPPSEDIVAATATLVFETNTPGEGRPSVQQEGEDWVELRRVYGFVCECDEMLLGDEYTSYRLRIVPSFWQSTLIETLDIFMELSIPDIIREKLTAVSMVDGSDFELRLDGSSYPAREFVVQYKETDHAFISRLCEHHGIFYFFEHQGDRDMLVFADHNGACLPIADPEEVPFVGRGEKQGVYELGSKTRLVPKTFVQRDYNYRNPQADLTAVSDNDGGFAGGIVEYGGHFKDADEGERLAEIRAQERKCECQVLRGKSAAGSFGAGSTFHLVDHPRGDRHLLLTEVLHHARQTTFVEDAKGDVEGYYNEFLAIPQDVSFRPPRLTPRPRVSGVLTGIIDGAAEGQYAELDEEGRYRVKFMFDTAEKGEGKASRVVRMMQPHSGAGYGMHFPLRVGTEVLIAFLDGDPDRPIIAGTVPNPLTASPVKADNAKRNVIRTGGGNEINIDDDDGNQRVKITSPYGSSVVQIGQANESENGIALGTMNNVSTTADGSVNALTTVQTNWNNFNDSWSCHITDYAGPTTPLARLQWGIDAFKGVAVMVGDIYGGILAIRNGLVTQKKYDLEKTLDDLDEQTGPRDKKRDTLEDCLKAAKDSEEYSKLSKANQNKIADLQDAITEYDEAVETLKSNVQDLTELKAEKAELETEKADLEAARTWADTLKDEIGAKQGEIDAKQDEIDAKQKEIDGDPDEESDGDRKAIESCKDDLDSALEDVYGDDDLAALSCKSGTLGAKAESFKESNDEYEQTRDKADKLGEDIADAEAALDGAQETKDWAGGLATVTDSLTAPLFSLVTTIWGTGMQGLARNVADFMLQEALAQDTGPVELAKKAYIPTPKMEFDLKSPPLFMKLVDPELEQRPDEKYGPISRLEWARPLKTNTKMVPGGGAGMLGAGKTALLALIPIVGPFLAYRYSSKQQGAFEEARNIQGSEAHSVLFGQTSVFVSGQEHAALTSAKKVVVTANDQVEVHSRGKTEVAGGEAVYLTSARAAEMVSRGTVTIKATGPIDASSADGEADRYQFPVVMDKDRAVLEMHRGNASLTAKDKAATKELAKVALSVDDNTSLGTLALENGEAKQSIKMVQNASDDANAITVDTTGTFTLTAAKGVTAENDKWTFLMDDSRAALGNDRTYVDMHNSQISIGFDDDNYAEFTVGGAKLLGANIDLSTDGNATVNGSKILLG